MTVYIELLIIDNFLFDYLIAYATLSFLKSKRSVIRILVSAAIGTLFAIFFPYIPTYLVVPYKVIALISSVAFIKKYTKAKEFFAALIAYVVVSTTLAGLVILMFNMKASSIYSTFIYDKGGAIGILSVAAILMLYAIRQIIGLYKERAIEQCIVDAELVATDINLKIKGLIDTGNQLRDENGQGVIILSAKLTKTLEKCKRASDVMISTINGQNVFSTITIDELKIYYKDKVNTISYVSAVLTERQFEGYDVILFRS